MHWAIAELAQTMRKLPFWFSPPNTIFHRKTQRNANVQEPYNEIYKFTNLPIHKLTK